MSLQNGGGKGILKLTLSKNKIITVVTFVKSWANSKIFCILEVMVKSIQDKSNLYSE